jgi:N-acetylmuramoyl-L-alanine amidase
MRSIAQLVVHCSATKAAQDIGAAEIRQWHLAQNWADIGYHFVIRRSGKVELGRPLAQAGAHVAGHNAHSIGICLVGGLDPAGKPENNFTRDQFSALRGLLQQLRKQYPETEILGHRDFPGVAKACPCFDVREWWSSADFSNVEAGSATTAPKE